MTVAAYVVGFGLHLVAGYFYLASGLLVPGPYLFVLWVVWIGLLVFAIRQRANLWLVVATPFAAAAFWFAFVGGLGSLLDWRP
jgi:steroid 5-alpha reductase family enzyme